MTFKAFLTSGCVCVCLEGVCLSLSSLENLGSLEAFTIWNCWNANGGIAFGFTEELG